MVEALRLLQLTPLILAFDLLRLLMQGVEPRFGQIEPFRHLGHVGLVVVENENGQPLVVRIALACRGPVRSILLLSKVPIKDVRTLALDTSSRSSVVLASIILEQGYNLQPETVSMPPDLTAMLGKADAALIIGDPALRIDPEASGLHALDLGEEWFKLTQLPMVFAIWAGAKANPDLAVLLEASYQYGRHRLEEIVMAEAMERNIWPGLAYEYLNSLIHYQLTDEHKRGMKLYVEEAIKMEGKQLA